MGRKEEGGADEGRGREGGGAGQVRGGKKGGRGGERGEGGEGVGGGRERGRRKGWGWLREWGGGVRGKVRGGGRGGQGREGWEKKGKECQGRGGWESGDWGDWGFGENVTRAVRRAGGERWFEGQEEKKNDKIKLRETCQEGAPCGGKKNEGVVWRQPGIVKLASMGKGRLGV